jgi:hypothetical protein
VYGNTAMYHGFANIKMIVNGQDHGGDYGSDTHANSTIALIRESWRLDSVDVGGGLSPRLAKRKGRPNRALSRT